MMRDLDANGAVKQDAVSSKVEIKSLTDLDRSTVFDPESWANVKVWLKNSRDVCNKR